MRVEHHKDGWTLLLNSEQIIPADPGAGTPALVIDPRGNQGTYWCCYNTDECDGKAIPYVIQRWLEDMLPVVDQFLQDHDQQAPVAGEITFGPLDDDLDLPMPDPLPPGAVIHRQTYGGKS
jgi:hypothetical protein